MITTNIVLNNINIALVEMTNLNNPYGPYINWTTFGSGKNAADSVKDASGQVKSAINLGLVITQLPGLETY